MSELHEFQKTFSRALLSPGPDSPFGPAFSVHRNNAMKALVEALEANYPTVAQLVGNEWFRACAVEYVRAHPARDPALVCYGDAFASFLETFGPAAGLPYLPDVARIDRLWTEAHTAADAEPLKAAALALLTPAAMFEQRLPLHPATRFAWVRHSAATIWLHHRAGSAASDLEVSGADEGILLTRPLGAVECAPLDRATFRFLNQLCSGKTLGEATVAAMEIEASGDLSDRLARLIASGTFANPKE